MNTRFLKKGKIIFKKVISSNHSFLLSPFAINVATSGIEFDGLNFEFFDESDSQKIIETVKNLGMDFEIITKYYDGHLTLSHGRLFKI